MSIVPSKKIYESFRLSKTFSSKDNSPITSLDYDDNGKFLIATSADDTIQLYDTVKGRYVKPIYSKKYGCHLAKFMHHNNSCVYASTKMEDNTIRYLSLTDNSYIRYFRGHKNVVNSLEVSPVFDIFISAALDNSIRMWDIRASNSQVFREIHGINNVAFDPAGLVVGVSDDLKGAVNLFDMKMIDASPFQSFNLPPQFRHNKIEFSNDNKYILFSSTNGDHLLYDAFEGKLVTTLAGMTQLPQSKLPSTGTAGFTPDGKFIYSGSGSGEVLLWDLSTIHKAKTKIEPCHWFGDDLTPRSLIFNPRFLQMVTADTTVNMWLPSAV